MLNQLIEWLESKMSPCFYKDNFGVECPGCGFQRSFIELLKGNIVESIKLYPALIPMLSLGILLFAQILFRFEKGWKIIKILTLATLVVFVGQYIYKII